MENIGLDLHKRESQLWILTAEGEVVERRIRTNRERFSEVLGVRAESEWVAQHLESLGHTVIVADPNFAPMYATRSRRVKTDRRDARTLAEACRLGAYRRIHRVSPERRHLRAELTVRDALLRTRTRYVAIVKARAPDAPDREPVNSQHYSQHGAVRRKSPTTEVVAGLILSFLEDR